VVGLRNRHGAQAQSALLRRNWLGTDVLGRDIVSLLLVGARTSIVVGIIAVGIRAVSRRLARADLRPPARDGSRKLIMRLGDFYVCVFRRCSPRSCWLLWAGPGMVTSIAAIGIFKIPIFLRVTRGFRQRDLGTRIRAGGGAPPARGQIPHHARARAAQYPLGPDRAGDDPVRAGDFWRRRRCPISVSAPSRRSLPGAGCSMTRRACLFQSPWLAVYPGSCDRNRGAGTESVGRRLAGSVRSPPFRGER